MKCSMKYFAVVLVLVSISIHSAVDAATIGYWRFEDSPGFLLDSSGNSNTLTNTSATHFTLPGSGDGSAISDPIPLTGDANAKAVDILAGAGVSILTGTSPLLTDDFTIEAFVNLDSRAGTFASIAAQWETGGNQRSWLLATQNNGGNPNELKLLLSDTGATTTSNVASGINIDIDDDYYVAASFDDQGVTPGGNVTFYVQNLTDGGTLQTATIAHSIDTLNVDDAFAIGSIEPGSTTHPWDGLIDEVRFSSGVLSVDELLITAAPTPSIPEPGSLTLLGLGIAGMMIRRRRRRVA